MTDQEKHEGQKTIVAFVSGLLVGGLLVWVFGGSPKADEVTLNEENDSPTSKVVETSIGGDIDNNSKTVNETSSASEIVVGTGSINVLNQPAGNTVSLKSATYPTEDGWVAVRIYNAGQIGSILGAARYSKEQGLVPTKVELLAPTVAGHEYAVVFFSEDGNRDFNLDGDVQLETGMTTFKAE